MLEIADGLTSMEFFYTKQKIDEHKEEYQGTGTFTKIMKKTELKLDYSITQKQGHINPIRRFKNVFLNEMGNRRFIKSHHRDVLEVFPDGSLGVCAHAPLERLWKITFRHQEI